MFTLFVLFKKDNEIAVGLHVYRKGPSLGVGWVMQGWGGSCKDGVDHTGVEWVIQGWGWSQRGGVGHAGVKWVMQGGVGHSGVGVRWVIQRQDRVDHKK